DRRPLSRICASPWCVRLGRSAFWLRSGPGKGDKARELPVELDAIERILQERAGRRLGPSQPPRSAFPLIAQQALKELDLLTELVIVVHQLLDPADRVQHRGVVAIAEPSPDLGQGGRGKQFCEIHADLAGAYDRAVAPPRQEVAPVYAVVLGDRTQDVVDAYAPWFSPAHEIAHDLLGGLDGDWL